MRILNFIFILILGQFFINCDRKENSASPEIRTEELTLTEEVDDIAPPPPEYTSSFKTLQEWLFNICDNKKPEKSISTFEFGLFEGEDNYTLYLVGLNKYNKTQNHSVTRIEFEPVSMYCTLPANEYKNLGRQQVIERVASQLKNFFATDKFKQSFLAKSKSITTSFKGEIWFQ